MLIWTLSNEWVALFWIQRAGQFILNTQLMFTQAEPAAAHTVCVNSVIWRGERAASDMHLSQQRKKKKKKKESNPPCFVLLFLLFSSICLASQHRHDEWESKGSTGGGARCHHRLLRHDWLQHHQHSRPGHRREGRGLFQAEGQVHEWAEQNPM